MISIADSRFYPEVIKEFNYEFGKVFVFDQFVVSEINQGIDFEYNQAQSIIADVIGFFGETKGLSINYVSNRIHSYSVMASDWIRFFKDGYLLNSYIVVSDKKRFCNLAIEKLFFKHSIKQFSELEAAINFVKKDMIKIN